MGDVERVPWSGSLRVGPVGEEDALKLRGGLRNQWFLIALAVVLVIGTQAATALDGLREAQWLRNGIVFTVMFLMALPVKATTIVSNLRRPWPALLATFISFVLIPLLALLASRLLNDSLGTGLLVVAATPCTLASASVWTARAGGNDTAALMTTVITNSVCFVVTPLIVWILVGQAADLNGAAMVIRLAALVLLPVVLAQLVRTRDVVSRIADHHRPFLAVLAQLGVLTMVLIGMVSTQAAMAQSGGGGYGAWLVAGALCLTVHLVALVAGYRLAAVLGMSRSDRIAVAISGSQKTMMTGLLVCIWLQVSLIPMVAWHVGQLVLDTLIADHFRRSSRGGTASQGATTVSESV